MCLPLFTSSQIFHITRSSFDFEIKLIPKHHLIQPCSKWFDYSPEMAMTGVLQIWMPWLSSIWPLLFSIQLSFSLPSSCYIATETPQLFDFVVLLAFAGLSCPFIFTWFLFLLLILSMDYISVESNSGL
jgi:hypothetical protein